jgi:MscS family membrane protein
MGIWEIPQSPITLDRVHGLRSNYQFDEVTLASIPALFDVIKSWSSNDSAYYSPDFYTSFALTPGRLLPPKWYLMLPESARNIADFSIDGENTALQILLAVVILFVYGVLIQFLAKRYLSNQKLSESASYTSRKSVSVAYVNSHNLANVFVALAAVGVSLYALHLIVYLSNLTGFIYRFVSFVLDISAFASASLFAFLALSVIGTYLSRSYLKATGRLSDQDRNRIGGAILPAFRFIGVCLAIYFFYQLLLTLGLPASAIVAFSAVPGLAIGLGASKMLGNLFAGLSIQSDRPFQVGDFIEIGAAKFVSAGFISRIGIRSIELLTETASVNFPNSKVDESSVVNCTFDLVLPSGERKRVTHINLDTDLQLSHTPEDLLLFEQALKDHLDTIPSVVNHSLSVERSLAGWPAKVVCLVTAEVVDWIGYELIRDGFADYLASYEAAMPAEPFPQKVPNPNQLKEKAAKVVN